MKLRATINIDLEVTDLKSAGAFQAELESAIEELTKTIGSKFKVKEIEFDLRERRTVKSKKRGE